MRPIKYTLAIVLFLGSLKSARGQDPSFSQFFSSPLNINPALTATINGDFRMIANCRDQWLGPASPYRTGTVSFDGKILKNKIPESSYLGLGGMLMYDEAMQGVLKSSYGSINSSYNIKIAEGENGDDHRFGVGLGLTYCHKQIDYSSLSFSNQFTGYGFDLNMPTGESALTNMKPYISANLGFLYSYISQYSNIDIGVAGFHLNRPKQTVTEDPKQFLPVRYVAHANYSVFLNERVVLNTNAIYQIQSRTSYFSAGGAVGYYLSNEGEEDVILNAGLWYWSNNAIVPYLGLVYQNFQFGLTYDVVVSKLAQASTKPKTFELSVIIRSKEKIKGIIPCPWK